MDNWNFEIINILNKIRLNSITLSTKHRNTALYYQNISRYFDVPIIICSTFASSIGSISYMPSDDKNQINLFISMFITILTSVKLYLNITLNLNNEVALSRDFYILSVDIYKNLNLRVNDRPDATTFLNECYSEYIKLTEQSQLYAKIKRDELLKIDREDDDETMSSSSSSSSLSSIVITDRNEF
jgi:hypothetical protein